MFIEDEDWNDEPNAQILSESLLSKKPNNSANVKCKIVGKKSLLRTLQTLGPVPEWKSDSHQRDSDSDAEAAPSHTKRKKKRRRKKTTSGEQENDVLDPHVQEEETLAPKKKENKSRVQKEKTTSTDETKGKEIPNSVSKPENASKLSRKQWKNKLKNKRKCNNKYRPNKPEKGADKCAESANQQRPKAEVSDSFSKSKKTPSQIQEKKIDRKPQKRKKPEKDVGSMSATETEETEKKTKRKEGAKAVTKLRAGDSGLDMNEQQHQIPVKRPKPDLSKEQNLKRQQLRKILGRQETDQQESPAEQEEEEEEEEPAVEKEEDKPDRSASLRSRMEQRLESARFRYINEILYSTSSGEAKRMFSQDPEAFGIYHRGYTAQVQKWPVNPVDVIIAFILNKPRSLVVADFGCGDCKIARSVKNKVHSFDLSATCDLVTVCDMANVPLGDRSVDIAVFCLSLMGTNLAEFLAEANRVLKIGGVLKIAEVASRFENVRSFITALANLGFKLTSKETENSHFYSFELIKTGDAPDNIKKFGLQLKACVYKKR